MGNAPRTWGATDWIAVCAITAAAAALRLFQVAFPQALVFDEVHYAREACWYAFGASACGFPLYHLEAHPPLGKWLIALGIRIFGYNPLGWRMAAVVAGTLTVPLLYLLARRLLRSTVGAGLAAGLLTIDSLHFIHSRVAMLDIFVPLFVVAAFLFSVYDRDQTLTDLDADRASGIASVLRRPWRVMAGAAAGAAVASKWTAGAVVPAILLLTIGWQMAGQAGARSGRRVTQILRAQGLSLFICLVLLPLIIYTVTWAGRLPGVLVTWPWLEGSWIRALVRQHAVLLEFHSGLMPHPASSPPWDWLLLRKPVVYFLSFDELGYRIILGFGNPFIWWASTLALAGITVRVIRDRSPASVEAIIMAAVVSTFGPWLVMSIFKPPVPWYLLSTIPFMCLALGYLAGRRVHLRAGRVSIVTWTLASVAFFGFLYPWLTAAPVPYVSWRGMGPTLSNDCDTLRGLPLERLVPTRPC